MQKLIRNLLAKRGLLSALSLGATLTLLLMPSSEVKKVDVSIPYIDKLAHIALFASCAFAFYIDLRMKRKSTKQQLKELLLLFFAMVALGILIEYLQTEYLHRHAAVDDVIADTIGLLLGFVLASLLYNQLKARNYLPTGA